MKKGWGSFFWYWYIRLRIINNTPTQADVTVYIPISCLRFRKCGPSNPLVRRSASWFSVLMYVALITWFYWISRMKWNLTSICLVRWWNSGFLTSLIALWLSIKSSVDWSSLRPMSCRSLLIQTTSLPPADAATYSDSVVERETHFCRWLFHTTGPPF